MICVYSFDLIIIVIFLTSKLAKPFTTTLASTTTLIFTDSKTTPELSSAVTSGTRGYSVYIPFAPSMQYAAALDVELKIALVCFSFTFFF
jgi:hypothetical protein